MLLCRANADPDGKAMRNLETTTGIMVYDPRIGKYGAVFFREGGTPQDFEKPDSQAWVLHLRACD